MTEDLVHAGMEQDRNRPGPRFADRSPYIHGFHPLQVHVIVFKPVSFSIVFGDQDAIISAESDLRFRTIQTGQEQGPFPIKIDAGMDADIDAGGLFQGKDAVQTGRQGVEVRLRVDIDQDRQQGNEQKPDHTLDMER